MPSDFSGITMLSVLAITVHEAAASGTDPSIPIGCIRILGHKLEDEITHTTATSAEEHTDAADACGELDDSQSV
jgi:hypothetical protein